jgi:hypothetical protein
MSARFTPHLISVILISLLNISFVFAQEATSNESDEEINIVHFYKKNKLIVVPAVINDTLKVNFIVDPRCKSVVLFGKRFEKLLRATRKSDEGNDDTNHQLLLNNKIKIGPATSENIAIAIVPNMDPMNFFTSVHGIIGFDMFGNYDITMDKRKQIITFKPTTAQSKLELFPPAVHYR